MFLGSWSVSKKKNEMIERFQFIYIVISILIIVSFYSQVFMLNFIIILTSLYSYNFMALQLNKRIYLSKD